MEENSSQHQHQREDNIRKFWENHRIFQKSLAKTEKGKRFIFFEGPPTANGKPGIHHFLGRAFKDLFSRYKTMNGFFVLRRAGWDTHGLPVEIEIEKELGFKSKKDIEEFGIDRFNEKAKESVWKYKKDWEEMTKKMGFWLDLENPYITYENSYIESVWWIIKRLFDKDLLYKGHKVLPYCYRCGTALSSHEVAQGYKDVTDVSIYVKFKIKSGQKINGRQIPENTFVLAWTTTPWTLPGNVALAVKENINYVTVKQDAENLILAQDLATKILGESFKINERFQGSDLVGIKYEPLFKISSLESENSYKIYPADFVNIEDGTGIVHTAVMYGEDDYQLGKRFNLPTHHTVDLQGKFTEEVSEFANENVKETNLKIIDYLKNKGAIFKEQTYSHSYPHCWRCHTPLIYYAKNSWFIRMSSLKDTLVKNNQQINWIPAHLKDGRFGEFLKEVKDWALSRERYWGTPLPIWQCVQCQNIKVLGSIEEIKKHGVGSKNTYILIRHAHTSRHETKDPIVNSILEKDKYHLTEEGKKQIEKSIHEIKAQEKRIDAIYSSPFLRTKESAEIAGKIFHKTVQFDSRITEIGHTTQCEGQEHANGVCKLRGPRKNFNDTDGNGEESWHDTRKRVFQFISEIENKYRGKKILIISHGDPLWLLAGVLEAKSEKQMLSKDSKNFNWYPGLGLWKKFRLTAMPRNSYGEPDLHRPFIDKILIKCSHCKAIMKKVPDLIDVWFDSGAMPYAQWHWPFENKKVFSKQFPADFITEGIDQTRGWFYTLLAIATALDKKAPYKNVASFGHIVDESGQKMSKSKGNVISPFEVMDKFGADPARWYLYTLNQIGETKSFNEKDLKTKVQGMFRVLENSIRFWSLYKSDGDNGNFNHEPENLLDEWLLSRLNSLIQYSTKCLNEYDPTSASREVEHFVIEDLSNWWIRRSRERFQSKQSKANLTLRLVLLELSKILSPFIPHTAEDMHIKLHPDKAPGTESIHLHDWPKSNKKLINSRLEDKMNLVKKLAALGLSAREKAGIKVRQPLLELKFDISTVLINKNESQQKMLNKKLPKIEQELLDILGSELNIKHVRPINKNENRDNKSKEVSVEDYGLKVILNTEITPQLRWDGWVREFIRAVQGARRDGHYLFNQQINCHWSSADEDLKSAIESQTDFVKEKTLLTNLEFYLSHSNQTYDIEKEFELETGRKVWFGLKK